MCNDSNFKGGITINSNPPTPVKSAFIYVKYGKAKIGFKIFIELLGSKNEQ